MKAKVFYLCFIIASFFVSCSYNNTEKKILTTTDSNNIVAEKKLDKNSEYVNIYLCEEGLFFILDGDNRIKGAINFNTQTGSCLFVFKGIKDGNGYKIQCADYNDDQLNSGKLDYEIIGQLQIDSNKNVTIRLSKEPDVCNKALGVSLVEGIAFNILSVNQQTMWETAIVKKDFVLNDNISKSKISIYRNEILGIISIQDNVCKVAYFDYINNKQFIGEITRENLLLID